MFFERLAVISSEVLVASESDVQFFFPISDRDILGISEVQNEIKVVWVEVNALPSKLKLSEIRFKPRNHYKINDWHFFAINMHEASIYDLQCLVKFTAGVCGSLFNHMI